MSRTLLGMLVICGLCFSIMTTYVGCGDDGKLKVCAKRSDCPDGFSCLKKLCHKQCGKDADCEKTGETCISSYCGGIRKEEKVVKDGGVPTVCTPGDSQECYDGPQGTDGTGICVKGKQVCKDDGQWDECKGQVTPKGSEECNKRDDNCNGKVDEECGTSCNVGDTRPCYTGPSTSKDVGPCKAGLETCEKAGKDKPAWSQCKGQVLPTPPENCKNKIDDDCNGKVNDGCECTPGETRDCKADNGCGGIQSCQVKSGGSQWTKCIASKPRPEKCNNLDDDCNGKTDEDKDGKRLTRPCTNVCFNGIETCKGGQWKDCSADLPKSETCNNADDDCDGKIDNIKDHDKPLLKGCDTGKPGLCKNGRKECKAGKWGNCIEPPKGTEDCNGYDDDCDGKTDEKEDKPCGDGAECIKDTLGTKKCVPK